MYAKKYITLISIKCLFFAIAACSIESSLLKDYTIHNLDESEFHARSWTLLVYMSADNDLEEYAIQDINELESAFNLANHNVNVLALVDRSPHYTESHGNWDGTRLYQIRYDKDDTSEWTSRRLSSEKLGLSLEHDTELDMGNVQTLVNFIDDGKDRFASEYMGLIFWGHGSGFRNSSSSDTSISKLVVHDASNGMNALYTQEIARALRNKGVNYVGFDACLGGHIEIAYELRDIADVFVASPDLESVDGWEYDYLLGTFMMSEGNPQDLARASIDAFRVRYSREAYTTIGAFDLSGIDAVNTALNDFSLSLSAVITDAESQKMILNQFLNKIEEVRIAPGMLSMDIGDMAAHFSQRLDQNTIPFLTEDVKTSATRLLDRLRQATIAEWNHPLGNGRSTGLVVGFSYITSHGSIATFPHSASYIQGAAVNFPLSFVADSNWVPNRNQKRGLLYHLLYATY